MSQKKFFVVVLAVMLAATGISLIADSLKRPAPAPTQPKDYGNGVYGFTVHESDDYGRALSAFIAAHPELDCRGGGNFGLIRPFIICKPVVIMNAQDVTVP